MPKQLHKHESTHTTRRAWEPHAYTTSNVLRQELRKKHGGGNVDASKNQVTALINKKKCQGSINSRHTDIDWRYAP